MPSRAPNRPEQYLAANDAPGEWPAPACTTRPAALSSLRLVGAVRAGQCRPRARRSWPDRARPDPTRRSMAASTPRSGARMRPDTGLSSGRAGTGVRATSGAIDAACVLPGCADGTAPDSDRRERGAAARNAAGTRRTMRCGGRPMPRAGPLATGTNHTAGSGCPHAWPDRGPLWARHCRAIIRKGLRLPRLRSIAAFVRSLHRRPEGQGLAEYALLLALIAILAISALIFLGSNVSSTLSNVGDALDGPVPGAEDPPLCASRSQVVICVPIDVV